MNCLVNVTSNKKLSFYIGEACSSGNDDDDDHKYSYDDDDDDKCDDGDDDGESNCQKGYFHVHPEGVIFNGSVMVPNGQIQVHQDACSDKAGFMNGQFIAKYFHAEAKYVYWNWNSCSSSPFLVTRSEDEQKTDQLTQQDVSLKVYPNPAHNTASVEFSVPEDDNVVIEVYNLVGQNVKTLYNEYTTKGQKQIVKMNPMEFEMGVYYIRLTTANESYSQKLVIVR